MNLVKILVKIDDCKCFIKTLNIIGFEYNNDKDRLIFNINYMNKMIYFNNLLNKNIQNKILFLFKSSKLITTCIIFEIKYLKISNNCF